MKAQTSRTDITSTGSRDLQFIKQEAKKKIEKYINEGILFEYLRYIAGSNEVTRELWGTVQNEKTMTKDKMNALSLIVVLPDIGNNLAYRHGLHFCQEVYSYTYRNQK